MSAFHANNLHRKLMSFCLSIRWGFIQIAEVLMRYWITIVKMPTSKSMPTSEELMMPTNESMMPTSETLMMPTSEESMPTEKLKMPTNEESMPTEELMPTQALKKRTKLARL